MNGPSTTAPSHAVSLRNSSCISPVSFVPVASSRCAQMSVGFAARIAIFFPDEPALALLIVDRHAVDRAGVLRDEWTVIGPWAFRLVCSRHGDRERSALFPSDVVKVKLVLPLLEFRSPEVRHCPLRHLGKTAPTIRQFTRSVGVENRKLRRPFRRRGGRVIVIADAHHGRISVIAPQHGIACSGPAAWASWPLP